MRRLIGLLLFCFLGYSVMGQQLPQLSTHADFYTYYNPAAIESIFLLKRDDRANYISFFHKSQWLGSQIDGAPASFGFNGQYLANPLWNLGIGFLADEAGAIGTWRAYTQASRRLFGQQDEFDLSLGGGLLVGGTSIDLNKIDESDRADPIFLQEIDKSPFVRASLGLFARKDVGERTDLYLALSVFQFRGFGTNRTLNSAHHFYGKFGFIYKTVQGLDGGSKQYIEGSIDYNYQPAAPDNWELVLQYYFLFEGSDTRLSVGLGFNNRDVLYLKSVVPLGTSRWRLGVNYGLLTLFDNPVKALSNENALEVRLIYSWLSKIGS